MICGERIISVMRRNMIYIEFLLFTFYFAHDSSLDFSLMTVNEYFFPVVAAARDTTVVVSSKLLLLVELKTMEEIIPSGSMNLFSMTGLKKFFFISRDNVA